MAQKVLELRIVLAMVAILWAPCASAQSSGCTTAIVSLAPCLGYITGNSSTPSPSCCLQLSSVVQTQAQCLCSLINGSGANLGLTINQTQALTLPGACNVQTPPLSQCNAASSGPAASPALAPTALSVPSTPLVPSNIVPQTPSTPSVPTSSAVPTSPSTSSDGSKTVPTGQSSGGISLKSPDTLVFAIVSLAACFSTFTSI